MPALIYIVAWGALIFAAFLTSYAAYRFIVHGYLSDMLVMIVALVCLCVLAAVVDT